MVNFMLCIFYHNKKVLKIQENITNAFQANVCKILSLVGNTTCRKQLHFKEKMVLIFDTITRRNN